MNDMFTCPECGSHYWGSSGPFDVPEKFTGHCHGYLRDEPRPCRFSWLRKDDDKYFGPRTPSPTSTQPAAMSDSKATTQPSMAFVGGPHPASCVCQICAPSALDGKAPTPPLPERVDHGRRLREKGFADVPSIPKRVAAPPVAPKDCFIAGWLRGHEFIPLPELVRDGDIPLYQYRPPAAEPVAEDDDRPTPAMVKAADEMAEYARTHFHIEPVAEGMERFSPDIDGEMGCEYATVEADPEGEYVRYDQAAAILQSRDATIEGLRAELAEAWQACGERSRDLTYRSNELGAANLRIEELEDALSQQQRSARK